MYWLTVDSSPILWSSSSWIYLILVCVIIKYWASLESERVAFWTGDLFPSKYSVYHVHVYVVGVYCVHEGVCECYVCVCVCGCVCVNVMCKCCVWMLCVCGSVCTCTCMYVWEGRI